MLCGDSATSLFSQVSMCQVVCEAAVWFVWLLDSAIDGEEGLLHYQEKS